MFPFDLEDDKILQVSAVSCISKEKQRLNRKQGAAGQVQIFVVSDVTFLIRQFYHGTECPELRQNLMRGWRRRLEERYLPVTRPAVRTSDPSNEETTMRTG